MNEIDINARLKELLLSEDEDKDKVKYSLKTVLYCFLDYDQACNYISTDTLKRAAGFLKQKGFYVSLQKNVIRWVHKNNKHEQATNNPIQVD